MKSCLTNTWSLLKKNMQTSSATSKFNNWQPETEEVYSRLEAMATKDGWVRSSNTNSGPKPSRDLFPRVITENGQVIHYAFFIHLEYKKLCGVCQFGVDAQGPRGYAHGGASATIHDSCTGVLTENVIKERCVTANLNVNFKNPTPLRAAILLEASVDRIEGKKVFLKACLKSPDGAIIYSESTALYINIENKIRAMEEKSK